MSKIYSYWPKAFVILLVIGYVVGGEENDTANISPTEPTQDLKTDAPSDDKDLPSITDEKSSNGDQGQIVGQSLIPGFPAILPGLSPVISNPFSLFALLFPTLAALTTMQLPGRSLLGSSQTDQQSAASKVVLVLAEDRDDQTNANVQKKQATRTARQSQNQAQQPGLNQLLNPEALSQIFGMQTSAGSLLGQAFTGTAQSGLLGQALTEDDWQQAADILAQPFAGDNGIINTALTGLTSIGGESLTGGSQLLGQSLAQVFGGEGQSDGGLLGQSLNQVLGGNTGDQSDDSIVSQQFASLVPTMSLGDLSQQLSQILNRGMSQIPTTLQQALNRNSGSSGTVGSTQDETVAAPADDSSKDVTSPPTTTVSQAQQPPSRTAPTFEVLRNLLQNVKAPWALQNSKTPEAQASEISEVRVKPDFIPKTSDTDMSEDKLAEIKFQVALQEALRKKTAPVLWFRVSPSVQNFHTVQKETSNKHKTPEELIIEAKLKAFERQVITELKQLQEIVRHAKEMRTVAKGNAKITKESPYKLSYPLSQTPVHKITHEDIEKALNDEYVRKSLQKAVQQHIKNDKYEKSNEKYFDKYTQTSLPSKRQIMTSDQKPSIKQMSKEELFKMLAYAYRMAAANEMNMARSRAQNEQKMSSAFKSSDGNIHGISDQRQWIQPQSKTPLTQVPNMNQQKQIDERQWAEDKNKQQQMQQERQWAEDKNKQQQMQQERQWAEDKNKQQQMQQERQWAEDKNKEQQMQQQRQWAEVKNKQEQIAQNRQWAEQQNSQSKFPQRQMLTNENMPMLQQWIQQDIQNRQWADEKKKNHMENEQRQWTEQQNVPEKQMISAQAKQNFNLSQRQWMESEKTDQQKEAQHRQLEENKKLKQLSEQQQPSMKQLVDGVTSSIIDTNQNMMQQRKLFDPQSDNSQSKMENMRQSITQNQQEFLKNRQWIEANNPQTMQQQQQKQQLHHQQIIPENRQTMDSPIDIINEQINMGMMAQPDPNMQRQMMEMQMFKNPNEPAMLMETMQMEPRTEQHNHEIVGESTPQIPENEGKSRHKGSDLFDDLSLLDLGGFKGNRHHTSPPTVINYYFGQGGNRYPVYSKPIYSSRGGYGGSTGGYGGSSGGYGGSSGGYGGSAGHNGGYGGGYGESVGHYGGLVRGYEGSSNYGSHQIYGAGGNNGYRSATGNDEIETMLRQHHTLSATHFRK